MGVALTSAIVAAVAAVASLLAGAHANEAMVAQMKASDQWAYYQAKGIKANVLASQIKMLEAFGKPVNAGDQGKLEQYKQDQEEIKKDADKEQHESEHHLKTHEIFARAVTLSQIAIAMSAIAVLTRRRKVWYLGLGAAAVGVGFLVQGFLSGG